jgi:hypothetical protein
MRRRVLVVVPAVCVNLSNICDRPAGVPIKVPLMRLMVKRRHDRLRRRRPPLFIGGLEFGYDWQGSNFLLEVEGDVDGSVLDRPATLAADPAGTDVLPPTKVGSVPWRPRGGAGWARNGAALLLPNELKDFSWVSARSCQHRPPATPSWERGRCCWVPNGYHLHAGSLGARRAGQQFMVGRRRSAAQSAHRVLSCDFALSAVSPRRAPFEARGRLAPITERDVAWA